MKPGDKEAMNDFLRANGIEVISMPYPEHEQESEELFDQFNPIAYRESNGYPVRCNTAQGQIALINLIVNLQHRVAALEERDAIQAIDQQVAALPDLEMPKRSAIDDDLDVLFADTDDEIPF